MQMLPDSFISLMRTQLGDEADRFFSSLLNTPEVVPKQAYSFFGVAEQNLIPYNFIDVALWLDTDKLKFSQEAKKAFLKKFGFANENKPLILAREEEYKAHYVKKKYPLFYEALHTLAREANIIIMPRYEREYLEAEFGSYPSVRVAKETLFTHEFYPCIDMLLGGLPALAGTKKKETPL